jgi:hypothetical protein
VQHVVFESGQVDHVPRPAFAAPGQRFGPEEGPGLLPHDHDVVLPGLQERHEDALAARRQ